MKYAIWNNKGGVGKTFLTFTLASAYAAKYPEKNVHVIDMCPQADVSEIFLGGSRKGARAFQRLMAVSPQQTIGGYFDTRVAQPHSPTGEECRFSVRPSDNNDNVPRNIRLIAGDPFLELQAEAMNQIANQTLPQDAWLNVHSWLADLCQAIERETADSVFFIDCNPSFAAYTELAIVAADQLIIPCSADGGSARAIENIGQLVYGRNVPQQYARAAFTSRLKEAGLAPPSIKMIVLNRSTQYDRRASQAFSAMFKEIRSKTGDLMRSEELQSSAEDRFLDIPDTHSVAIVSSHHGLPIGGLRPGPYPVYDKNPMVNREPLERYRQAIDRVVSRL